MELVLHRTINVKKQQCAILVVFLPSTYDCFFLCQLISEQERGGEVKG